ncbi:hypothetical protein HDC93_006060 [Streptomyces sp. AK010]|nr:hypothetical protein [Streptomyces sp. AK010]
MLAENDVDLDCPDITDITAATHPVPGRGSSHGPTLLAA